MSRSGLIRHDAENFLTLKFTSHHVGVDMRDSDYFIPKRMSLLTGVFPNSERSAGL